MLVRVARDLDESGLIETRGQRGVANYQELAIDYRRSVDMHELGAIQPRPVAKLCVIEIAP